MIYANKTINPANSHNEMFHESPTWNYTKIIITGRNEWTHRDRTTPKTFLIILHAVKYTEVYTCTCLESLYKRGRCNLIGNFGASVSTLARPFLSYIKSENHTFAIAIQMYKSVACLPRAFSNNKTL